LLNSSWEKVKNSRKTSLKQNEFALETLAHFHHFEQLGEQFTQSRQKQPDKQAIIPKNNVPN
jgi:hypothetical protein